MTENGTWWCRALWENHKWRSIPTPTVPCQRKCPKVRHFRPAPTKCCPLLKKTTRAQKWDYFPFSINRLKRKEKKKKKRGKEKKKRPSAFVVRLEYLTLTKLQHRRVSCLMTGVSTLPRRETERKHCKNSATQSNQCTMWMLMFTYCDAVLNIYHVLPRWLRKLLPLFNFQLTKNISWRSPKHPGLTYFSS